MCGVWNKAVNSAHALKLEPTWYNSRSGEVRLMQADDQRVLFCMPRYTPQAK
jgi:hypothetical protein